MSTKVFNIGEFGRTISPVARIDFEKNVEG